MVANASGHARQLNGNIITNNTFAPSELSMSQVMWQAEYNSQSNQDQDYCYEGTRKDLLDKVLSEITSSGSGALIWLKGPAGFGKSAIAKTICLSLDHTKRDDAEIGSLAHEVRLGASYFFRRADTERSDINKMIFTIAQQLSERVDGFRPPPRVYQEQRIAQMEPDTLFRDIVRKPLEPLSGSRIAIVIDALDECTTSSQVIVELFSQLRDIPESSACVRIVFTSRPQPRINDLFETLQPKLTVDLDNKKAVKSSQKDISIFLKNKFRIMCPCSSTHVVPADCKNPEWPSREDFDRAVHLATTPKPLFIYAVTMCRFIGSDSADPRDRLQQWLGANRGIRSPTTSSPDMEYQLFSMYRIFFREVESGDLSDFELNQLRLVLHSVLVVGNNLPMKGLLQLLSCVRPGRTNDAFEPKELLLLRRNLQPILEIPEDVGSNSILKVYHKSLIDFLEQARPGDSKLYPFNRERSGLELGIKSLSFLSDILSQNQDEVDNCAKDVAEYAFHHWPHFLAEAKAEISDETDKIVTRFLKHDFLASFRLSGGLYDSYRLSLYLSVLSKVIKKFFC